MSVRMEVDIGQLGYLLVLISSLCAAVDPFAGNDEMIKDMIEDLSHHGSIYNHQEVHSLQPHCYAGILHKDYSSASIPPRYPLVETFPFVKTFGNYWEKRTITGRYTIVHHPAETLSVLEPGGTGGCARDTLVEVQPTAATRKCLFASNAGFYNTTTGACLGNVVSDGKERHNLGGRQNAHFGIHKDGTLFFGYIPEDLDIEAEFSQLITGVMWLVRDGHPFIHDSAQLESPDFQTAVDLEAFTNVISGRMAIGNDRAGNVVIIYVEGKTGIRGVNLHEFVDLLVFWDVLNAINLDGGGSVSAVVNGTYVNRPSDLWKRNSFAKSGHYRAVSTVICVHEPESIQRNCINHAYCSGAGLSCDQLNCTGHGD